MKIERTPKKLAKPVPIGRLKPGDEFKYEGRNLVILEQNCFASSGFVYAYDKADFVMRTFSDNVKVEIDLPQESAETVQLGEVPEFTLVETVAKPNGVLFAIVLCPLNGGDQSPVMPISSLGLKGQSHRIAYWPKDTLVIQYPDAKIVI